MRKRSPLKVPLDVFLPKIECILAATIAAGHPIYYSNSFWVILMDGISQCFRRHRLTLAVIKINGYYYYWVLYWSGYDYFRKQRAGFLLILLHHTD